MYICTCKSLEDVRMQLSTDLVGFASSFCPSSMHFLGEYPRSCLEVLRLCELAPESITVSLKISDIDGHCNDFLKSRGFGNSVFFRIPAPSSFSMAAVSTSY